MRKIAVEEHCFTQRYVDFFQSRKEYPKLESVLDEKGNKVWRWKTSDQECQTWFPSAVVSRICDIEDIRLKDMDEAGIDMQVLSFNANIDMLGSTEGTALTKEINDIIAGAIRKHPDRFAGFARLFLKSPDAAADELERAVEQSGFKGAMVLSHVEGEYIDARKFWPVFERAAKLDVPVYIHPTFPPPERLKPFAGYPELVGPAWGYAVEAGMTAVRLICSGIFDQYPGLKIILGHMGEALPFWMSRLDQWVQTPTSHALQTHRDIKEKANSLLLARKLKKLPSHYIKDNFWVTTSGMFWQPVVEFVSSVLGAEKILFAVDYPFESNKQAAQFAESMTIPAGDKEKICHANAEKLLRISSHH